MRPPALAGFAAALGVILVGCGVSLPKSNDIANSIEFERQGASSVATISPWPLDRSVAFFCLRDPGDAFSVENPSPPAAAGCSAVNATTSGDRLIAKFDPTSLDPATAAAFAGQQKWFIAVAGSRGPVALATSFAVMNPEQSN